MRSFFIAPNGDKYECINENPSSEEKSFRLVNCVDCGFVMGWDMTFFPDGEELRCRTCAPDRWVEHE